MVAKKPKRYKLEQESQQIMNMSYYEAADKCTKVCWDPQSRQNQTNVAKIAKKLAQSPKIVKVAKKYKLDQESYVMKQ